MTGKQIRDWDLRGLNPETVLLAQAQILREIAAQLAEMNEFLKQGLNKLNYTESTIPTANS